MPDTDPQPLPKKTPRFNFADFRRGFQNISMKVTKRAMQSFNFVTGSLGWKITAAGDLEASSGTFRGKITAGSIDIPDDTTANSFHVDSEGNTFWGATTIGSSLASVTKEGVITAVGLTSLNLKSYTAFETEARFNTTDTPSNTGAVSFGNQGCQFSTGTTATSHVKILLNLARNIFANNPLLVGSFNITTKGTNDGRFVFGLGDITIAGAGVTEADGRSFCGWYIRKATGNLTLQAYQQNSANDFEASGTVALLENDFLELFMKVTSSNIKYYYRRNDGALTLLDTMTDGLPDSSEADIFFGITNNGTASNFVVQASAAAYEH